MSTMRFTSGQIIAVVADRRRHGAAQADHEIELRCRGGIGERRDGHGEGGAAHGLFSEPQDNADRPAADHAVIQDLGPRALH